MAENTVKTPAQDSAFKTLAFPVIILVVICVVCSAILAGLNSVTEPIIAANTLKATQEAYLAVMPAGTDASSLTTLDTTTKGVEGAVSDGAGAVAVKAAASGYSGGAVTVYVAFAADGTISNISIDSSTQTTGIGSKTGDESFYGGFVGWDSSSQVSNGSPVDSIAGATISSNAAFTAINAAIDCYNNELKGVA